MKGCRLFLYFICFIYFIFFLSITSPASAELSKKDIEEIRKIVREELVHVDKQLYQIDKRFEQVDKRFEQVDKRFEQVDKRFEQMMNFMWMLSVIFSSITAVTIGFAIWDRRTMVRPFEMKVAQIEARIDDLEKRKLVTLIDSLREIAKSDSKVAEALKKFNLL